MKIEPYLFFNGRCDEAIAFYKEALGAEVTMLMRMNEAPDPPPPGAIPPGFEHKVMHASLRIGGTMLMMSDGMSEMQPSFKGFSLSLEVADATEAERRFTALLQGGGKVTMPVGKTFWSPAFGMLEDRFGVGWMVIAPA
jgi:PhnB protein